MSSNIYQQTGTTTATVGHESIANKSRGRDTSAPKLKFPESKRILLGGATAVILVFATAYYFLMPVAEVATVRRGTAISAVYGTVRIEPAFVGRVRAPNDGFLRLGEPFSAGRGAICKRVGKRQRYAASPAREKA